MLSNLKFWWILKILSFLLKRSISEIINTFLLTGSSQFIYYMKCIKLTVQRATAMLSKDETMVTYCVYLVPSSELIPYSRKTKNDWINCNTDSVIASKKETFELKSNIVNLVFIIIWNRSNTFGTNTTMYGSIEN